MSSQQPSESDPWFSNENDVLGEPEEVFEDEDNLRYSVASMMIATSLVALSVVLLKWLSVFGLLILVAGMVAITGYLKRSRYPGRRKVHHAMWGIVLPLLCIIYDPGFLHQPWYGDLIQPRFQFNNLLADQRGMLFLPPIILQCGALAIWLVLRPQLKSLAGVFCGVLHTGSCIAFVIGVCLFPFACIGILAAGLGLLGLTPLWTAYTYHQNANDAYRSEIEKEPRSRLLEVRIGIGVLLAILVPISFSLLITGLTLSELIMSIRFG